MKKGSSLVEVIAVIIILGIIASIATVTVITIVNRQRENATLASLNNIYNTAKEMLISVETSIYDENITVVDENFCYISLTTMLENGIIDGSDYYPINNEIYFCYNMNTSFVLITNSSVTRTIPDSTGSANVNGVEVTFDFTNDKFITA